MSRYNPLSVELSGLAFHMLVIGIPTVLIGMLADNYVSRYFIWGGMDCTTGPNGIEGCFGYPPAGIIVIGIVVGVCLSFVFSRLTAHSPD
jgi:hypothetical protein